MAAPDSSGRILRIEDADTSARVDQPEEVVLSKPCVVAGCTGTMHFRPRFHSPLDVVHVPHTWGWEWHATWQWTQDPAHIQLIGGAEEREILRQRDRETLRRREQEILRRPDA